MEGPGEPGLDLYFAEFQKLRRAWPRGRSQPCFYPSIVGVTGLFLPRCQELPGAAVKADPGCVRQSRVCCSLGLLGPSSPLV